MIGITRGCGTRVKGGVYAECKLSPLGQQPIEFFLQDPPVKITEDLGLSPIGVKLINYKVDDDKTAWHVFDWVGTAHYPNVSDFVEEVRRFGLSRRLSRSIDFSQLSLKSKIVLVHGRAFIDNWKPYQQDRPPISGYATCPKRITQHQVADVTKRGMCIGLWWEDIEGGRQHDESQRAVTRVMESFAYAGYKMPDGDLNPRYEAAIFASFPITNLAVIRNPDSHKDHQQAFDAASKANIAVNLEDE